MKLTTSIIIFIALMVGAGCAKKKNSAADNDITPITDTDSRIAPVAPNATTPEDDAASLERSAEFFPASEGAFQRYVVQRPIDLDQMERFRIEVNVQEMWDDNIGGSVKISYNENGQNFESHFWSGDRSSDIQFNKWQTISGDEVFIGYFSDRFGAVVLVIDETFDLGDGLGSEDRVGGKVYFMNYEPTRAPESPTKCWNIEYGPYACGAVFSGAVPGQIINHDYPGRRYELLGTFETLSRSKAFNEDL